MLSLVKVFAVINYRPVCFMRAVSSTFKSGCTSALDYATFEKLDAPLYLKGSSQDYRISNV